MSSVNVKRTTSILFILRIVRLLMSLVTVSLTAKYFGVSVEKDAWLLATAFLTATTMIVWGPINETFRAKFIFIKEQENELTALKTACSLVSGIIIITLIIIAVLFFSVSKIANFTAHDLGEKGIFWFISLFTFLLPTLLIDEINNISSSILNSYDIFYIPEIVGALTGIFYILILIWLAPLLGIYSIIVGQYISTISLLLVLIFFLSRKQLMKKEWLLQPNFQLVKPFLYYALPFIFPYAIGQINFFTERWLAALLGVGKVSILDFSRRFTSILQSVIGSVLTTIMVPLLAKSHITKNPDNFKSVTKENITVIYGIMLLAIPLLLGASYPLCDFLFHRGQITDNDIAQISHLSRLYALAFLGVMIYVVFGNILLASEKGKLYAFWGVICQIAVVAVNFGFVAFIGLWIFPLSLGFIHLAIGTIMWTKGKVWSKEIIRMIVRNNIIVLISSMAIYFVSEYLLPEIPLLNLTLSAIIIIFFAIILSPFIGINAWEILKKIRERVKSLG